MRVPSDTTTLGPNARVLDPLIAPSDPWLDANRGLTDTPAIPPDELYEARLRAALTTRLAKNAEEAAMASPASDPGLIPGISWHSAVRAESVSDTADIFIQLPIWKAKSQPAWPYWRIQLCDIIPEMEPLCFDILDDVVIGRGPDADLDFYAYGIYERTLSRRHAILRPTHNHLYLIDMSSTNGTFFNTVPLGRCATYPITDGDTITLGTLSFVIRLASGPRPDAAVHH